jgi:dihydrofolate reductase
MRFRVYIAVSLDGYIATSDGGVEWLDDFTDEDYGYGEFIREISHAVMGRTTYDQAVGFGWSYTDLDSHVLTTQPLQAPPDRTEGWEGTVAELAEHLRTADSEGDCWLIGGARTIRAFEEIRAIDEYEIFVIPVVLGQGVPLFDAPYPRRDLQLLSVKAWDNGVVRLLYEPAYVEGLD